MPVNPEDRTTVVLGAALIRAVRQRAEAEGRGFSAVVTDAVTAYLQGEARPAEAALPGIAAAHGGLREEVRSLLGAVQQMLPRIAKVADDHDEQMDMLDEIVSELGRREGAALALEKAAALIEPEQG